MGLSKISDIIRCQDVKIRRSENNFITSIYRKPTYTGLFSKFYAFSPKQNKENLVYTLTYRAYKICSNFQLLHEQFQFLKDTLQLNGYPLKFVEQCIGKMLSKIHKSPNVEPVLNYNVPKAQVYFSTMYLGSISVNLTKDLKQILHKFYPQVQLLPIFQR